LNIRFLFEFEDTKEINSALIELKQHPFVSLTEAQAYICVAHRRLNHEGARHTYRTVVTMKPLLTGQRA
jgi:hypothetical protein